MADKRDYYEVLGVDKNADVVAASCNPYEESKEHGRLQAAKKSPVGSFLVFGSQPVGMSKRGGSRFDPCENCKRMSL